MNIPFLNKKEPYVEKTALIGDGIDYNVYTPTKKEKIIWFIIGAIAGGVIAHIFYERIILTVLVGVCCGFVFLPIRKNQVIKKRKQKLTTQFRGLLDALSTSISAGKNVYDSFASSSEDLAYQFGEDSDIVKEIQLIRVGLDNNYQIEELLLNFGERSGISDIYNFSNVFATCYKKGANIKDVIKNTAVIIGDKIEVQMEIETMVSGQKNEQNIMLFMPIIFVFIMKAMGGGLIDLQSSIGVVSVTIALAIFVAAYFAGRKILDIKF